jgi:ornithine carbamoyltransferase
MRDEASEELMAFNLKGRSLLSLLEYTPDEIRYLLDLSAQLKANKRAGVRGRTLEGKCIALLFEKPSTRTRCAFVAACVDEGAHPEYLGKNDIQFGKKESVKDTARVLGRMFDGIQFRGFAHATVEGLAKYSGVPVWNGLTDTFHPTQALADVLTLQESFGRPEGLAFAYVGDGRNNVANSLLVIAAKLGMDFRIVSPKQLFPDVALHAECLAIAKQTGAKLTVTHDIRKGVKGARALYTDVWASMGEEAQIAERIKLLGRYRITEAMFKATGRKDAIFLHCLPAFHDVTTEVGQKYPDICEVTDEVFEGPRSRVFDQAENRVHTIKAVMVATLG